MPQQQPSRGHSASVGRSSRRNPATAGGGEAAGPVPVSSPQNDPTANGRAAGGEGGEDARRRGRQPAISAAPRTRQGQASGSGTHSTRGQEVRGPEKWGGTLPERARRPNSEGHGGTTGGRGGRTEGDGGRGGIDDEGMHTLGTNGSLGAMPGWALAATLARWWPASQTTGDGGYDGGHRSLLTLLMMPTRNPDRFVMCVSRLFWNLTTASTAASSSISLSNEKTFTSSSVRRTSPVA